MSDEQEMTNCENCSSEILEDEVQQCEKCGMGGLGNCCISDLDHDCVEEEEDNQ